MLSAIQNSINEITRKYPNWDKEVAQFFQENSSQDSAPNEEILDAFIELLNKILEYAKTEDGKCENAIGLLDGYACQEYASRYIKLKLRKFDNYKPLRQLAENDMYKAKCCVDLIWSSYVLRFNPNLLFDEAVPLQENEFKSMAMQIDRFTDFCVERSFCFSAIATELREDSDFPEVLCDYIAGKIDADFEKLKLNYIINKLSMCERAIDELSER